MNLIDVAFSFISSKNHNIVLTTNDSVPEIDWKYGTLHIQTIHDEATSDLGCHNPGQPNSIKGGIIISKKNKKNTTLGFITI